MTARQRVLRRQKKIALGAFGVFPEGFTLESTWIALEEICREYCGGLWIGIYSAWNLVDWAETYAPGLLLPSELAALKEGLTA